MPVLLKDTLTTQPVNENATPNPGSNFTTIDGETRNTAGMTPYRVLQELRPDATEDQKDSAIQAHFKVGDIAYNTRTDTMTTFGIRVLKVKPFEKTRFMDTTYFHGGKYFHPELDCHGWAWRAILLPISCATTTPSPRCCWVASCWLCFPFPSPKISSCNS